MSKPAIKALAFVLSIPVFLLTFSPSPAYSRTSPIGDEITQTKTIKIDSSFSGENIAVRAVVPAGEKIALRFLGPRESLVLMKKGRVGGLWMNVEEIDFENIYAVYLLWTSEKVSPGMGDDLNYSSFLAGSLKKNSREKDLLYHELIKLKEADRLYRISEGSIQVRPMVKDTWDQVDAVLKLPAKIQPGSYTLELIAVGEGKYRLLRSSPIEVKLTGFPALVSDLAAKRGLLYGSLAVIIAIFSGLVIGVVFSSRGSH